MSWLRETATSALLPALFARTFDLAHVCRNRVSASSGARGFLQQAQGLGSSSSDSEQGADPRGGQCLDQAALWCTQSYQDQSEVVCRSSRDPALCLELTCCIALVRRENSTVSLGKYGSFKAKDLVGKPYGHTYEIVDGGLQVLQATLNEIGELGCLSRSADVPNLPLH